MWYPYCKDLPLSPAWEEWKLPIVSVCFHLLDDTRILPLPYVVENFPGYISLQG